MPSFLIILDNVGAGRTYFNKLQIFLNPLPDLWASTAFFILKASKTGLAWWHCILQYYREHNILDMRIFKWYGLHLSLI